MDTYEGRCKYCGEIQPVMTMDQIDADEKISECCKCDGANFEKKKAQFPENLDYTIGEGAANMESKRRPPERAATCSFPGLFCFLIIICVLSEQEP